MATKTSDITTRITEAKDALDVARAHGDELTIALAEDALNDLLEKYGETLVTGNKNG